MIKELNKIISNELNTDEQNIYINLNVYSNEQIKRIFNLINTYYLDYDLLNENRIKIKSKLMYKEFLKELREVLKNEM